MKGNAYCVAANFYEQDNKALPKHEQLGAIILSSWPPRQQTSRRNKNIRVLNVNEFYKRHETCKNLMFL